MPSETKFKSIDPFCGAGSLIVDSVNPNVERVRQTRTMRKSNLVAMDVAAGVHGGRRFRRDEPTSIRVPLLVFRPLRRFDGPRLNVRTRVAAITPTKQLGGLHYGRQMSISNVKRSKDEQC